MLDKAYNSRDTEADIYKMWEDSGVFTPKIPSRELGVGSMAQNAPRPTPHAQPFVISMPPPNVTGKLHIGHALFITLQDIMVRYHRLKGEPTLWVPGTDHAGIATQSVVDKALQKKGTSRRQLGREKFVEEVWKWKEQYGDEITHQLRAIGASCDWSRERFTLDEGLSKAVNEAFVDFYNKGLIYRGLRTVNWCPKCQTAIADDEVEYKKEIGKFYWIKYGPFTLATARPETKLGDTAVAVHPSDKRYKDMVGKKYMIPGVLGEFEVEVVADNAVDPKFGTGAVKVTPGHSLIDFEIAQRHDLPIKQVIDENGRMMENTGKYVGMKTREAREAIIEDMQKMGLIDHIEENYEHNIAVCYRCGGQIEPIPSKQWFVKMKPLAEKAKKAVKEGEIKIMPKRFEKVYYQWMDNIRDWCISRQLWWGHRIPVYYRKQESSKSKVQSSKNWDLKIYGQDIFDGIKNGTKTIELRAGKPEGADKYWGDFKAGDLIDFSLADSKTDKLVVGSEPVTKTVKAVQHFDDFDQLFKVYKAEDDYPGENEASLKKWWLGKPEFKERIEKYGIWVFELGDPTKTMGIAERVVPQILAGKTKTYRIRDHELKVGDKVYFENSTTGEIFGYGIMTESTKTKVKDLPLQDKSHGAVYKNLDELIEAFKFHNPDKEVTPGTDAYIYAYEFTPADKFENLDFENLKLIENCKLPRRGPELAEGKIGNSSDNEEIYVGIEPPAGDGWEQDPDVLDTWFSSGLWPFSTLGWPENEQGVGSGAQGVSDYDYFYPTTVMETGYDILFFWVARMIMMGLELTGEVPFKTVYLHGLVRDEQNRKMSKSLGNVLDPLDVSAKFGTDAMRMSLVVGNTAGNDVAVGEGKVKGYRNFSNKVWNVARFIVMNLEGSKLEVLSSNQGQNSKVKYTKEDEKDMAEFAKVKQEVTKALDKLEFSRAGEQMYAYIWHQFADKIIERSKDRLATDGPDKDAALAKLTKILVDSLKMLHPFVPFVTETIWQELPEEIKDSKMLISAKWPD